jgi:hypothetical protein
MKRGNFNRMPLKHTALMIGMVSCLSPLITATHAANKEEGVTLFHDMGSLHHPITTKDPRAQEYFNQGLRLVYAFNHEEAYI